jgi:hypothetical protein
MGVRIDDGIVDGIANFLDFRDLFTDLIHKNPPWFAALLSIVGLGGMVSLIDRHIMPKLAVCQPPLNIGRLTRISIRCGKWEGDSD